MDRREDVVLLEQDQVRELPEGEVGPRVLRLPLRLEVGVVVLDHDVEVPGPGKGGVGDVDVDLVHRLEAACLDDVAEQVFLREQQRHARPADASRRSGQAELRRQRQHPAGLQHPPHFEGGVRGVLEFAEVLDRARGEDPVEHAVRVAQRPAVHVLDDEAVDVERVGSHGLRLGQHDRGRQRHPGPRLEVAVGGEDLLGPRRQVEQRVLDPRSDPEHDRLRSERAEMVEGPHRHRHLPVLAVLGPLRVAGGEVGDLVGADLAHHGGEAGVVEILDLNDLVEGDRPQGFPVLPVSPMLRPTTSR